MLTCIMEIGKNVHRNAEIAKHCFLTSGKRPRQQPHQHTPHKRTGTKHSPLGTILKNLQKIFVFNSLAISSALTDPHGRKKKKLALKTKTKNNPQQTSQDWDQEITAENSSPACRLIK